jgi:hypothetical protein
MVDMGSLSRGLESIKSNGQVDQLTEGARLSTATLLGGIYVASVDTEIGKEEIDDDMCGRF